MNGKQRKPTKHPPFPFDADRQTEIQSGKKPMTDAERKEYLRWQHAVSEIKSAAGKIGAKKRWEQRGER